jgi:DNA gyrase subunit A
MIRTPVREISKQGRDATGVRVMNVGEEETVAAVAPVLQTDEEDGGPLPEGAAAEAVDDAQFEDAQLEDAQLEDVADEAPSSDAAPPASDPSANGEAAPPPAGPEQ